MPVHAEFLRLFLAHQQDIRAFIGAMVRDPQAREDVFQNVALTLWESFARFDADRSFGAWARGIAARKVLHAHRSDKRFPLVFSPEAVQAVLDAYNRTEQAPTARRIALGHCLAALPAKTREVLELRYTEDLSGESIALRTGLSATNVYQLLSRARLSLAECIRKRLARPTHES